MWRFNGNMTDYSRTFVDAVANMDNNLRNSTVLVMPRRCPPSASRACLGASSFF